MTSALVALKPFAEAAAQRPDESDDWSIGYAGLTQGHLNMALEAYEALLGERDCSPSLLDKARKALRHSKAALTLIADREYRTASAEYAVIIRSHIPPIDDALAALAGAQSRPTEPEGLETTAEERARWTAGEHWPAGAFLDRLLRDVDRLLSSREAEIREAVERERERVCHIVNKHYGRRTKAAMLAAIRRALTEET